MNKYIITMALVLTACGKGERGDTGVAGSPGESIVGPAGNDGADGVDGADGINAVSPSITIYQFPNVNDCLLIEGAYVKRVGNSSLEWHLTAGCGGAKLFSSKNIVQLSATKVLYVSTLQSNPNVMTAVVVTYN